MPVVRFMQFGQNCIIEVSMVDDCKYGTVRTESNASMVTDRMAQKKIEILMTLILILNFYDIITCTICEISNLYHVMTGPDVHELRIPNYVCLILCECLCLKVNRNRKRRNETTNVGSLSC